MVDDITLVMSHQISMSITLCWTILNRTCQSATLRLNHFRRKTTTGIIQWLIGFKLSEFEIDEKKEKLLKPVIEPEEGVERIIEL